MNESTDYDFKNLMIIAEKPDGILAAFANIMPSVPKQARIQVNKLKWDLYHRFGERVFFECCNNRSLGSIMLEYSIESTVLAEGGIDGKKYLLTKPLNEEE